MKISMKAHDFFQTYGGEALSEFVGPNTLQHICRQIDDGEEFEIYLNGRLEKVKQNKPASLDNLRIIVEDLSISLPYDDYSDFGA